MVELNTVYPLGMSDQTRQEHSANHNYLIMSLWKYLSMPNRKYESMQNAMAVTLIKS